MCGAETSTEKGVVLLVSDSTGEKRDHQLLVKESTSHDQMNTLTGADLCLHVNTVIIITAWETM